MNRIQIIKNKFNEYRRLKTTRICFSADMDNPQK